MRANAVSTVSTNSAKAFFALLLACACVLGKFRSKRIFDSSVSRIFGFSAYGFLCGCCSNLGGLLKDFVKPSRSEGTLGDFSPSVRNGGINGYSVSSVRNEAINGDSSPSVRNGGFLELIPAHIGAAVAKNSACQISVCYGSQFGVQAAACDLDLPFAVFLLSAPNRNGDELLTWAILLAISLQCAGCRRICERFGFSTILRITLFCSRIFCSRIGLSLEFSDFAAAYF